jgi:hypothetical protein
MSCAFLHSYHQAGSKQYNNGSEDFWKKIVASECLSFFKDSSDKTKHKNTYFLI